MPQHDRRPKQTAMLLQGSSLVFGVFAGVAAWAQQSYVPLITIARAAWDIGFGAGIAIDPGIAAMTNTTATTRLIQVRTGRFPNIII